MYSILNIVFICKHVLHTHTHTHTHTQTCATHTHTHTYTNMCYTHTHTYTNMCYTHTHTYTNMCYTHTHTHTHNMHASQSKKRRNEQCPSHDAKAEPRSHPLSKWKQRIVQSRGTQRADRFDHTYSREQHACVRSEGNQSAIGLKGATVID